MAESAVRRFILDNLVDFILIGIILLFLAMVLLTQALQGVVLEIAANIGYIAIAFLVVLFLASMILLKLKKKLYIRRVLTLGLEIFIGILLIGFLPQALSMITPHDYSAVLTMGLNYAPYSSSYTARNLYLDAIQNIPLSGNFVFGFESPSLAIVKAYCPNLISVGTALIPYGSSSIKVTVPGLSSGMTCNFIGYTTDNPSQIQEVEGVKI